MQGSTFFNAQHKLIEMTEGTPYATVNFQSTVPISCPPCSITFPVLSHVGLVLSACSVTFSATEPQETIQQMQVRAVQTAGSNSRVLGLSFKPAVMAYDDSAWNGYKLDVPKVSRNARHGHDICVNHVHNVCRCR